jgi:hypothetical protein
MDTQNINRNEVERRRDRLLNRFGDAPVYERRDMPNAGRFEKWVEKSAAGYIGSAYALIRRSPEQLPSLTGSMVIEGEEQERMLLALGRGGSKWGVPGGGQEADETMESTVTREVSEEVGISISLTDLNHRRHEIATCEGDDKRLHVRLAFIQI